MTYRVLFWVSIAAIIAFVSTAPAQPCGAYWAAPGYPAEGEISRPFVEFDDGTGPALYARIRIGSLDNVARWNGHVWEPLVDGMPAALSISSLPVLDDGTGPRLYAVVYLAGGLGPGNPWRWRVMAWDPVVQSWKETAREFYEYTEPLLSFDDGSGMAIYGQVVIVPFETSAPARWSGKDWEILGGAPNFGGLQLASFDDGTGPSLYVGGQFNEIGGVAAHRVARWDGSRWHPVGSGPFGTRSCRELVVIDDGPARGLYYLSTERVNGPNYLQKWDGQAWTVLPPPHGPQGSLYDVTHIAAFDDGAGAAIYLGGTFPFIDGIRVNGLARWDGFEWSPVGAGMQYGGVGGFGVFEDDPRGPSLFVNASARAPGTMVVGGGQVPTRLAQWVGCPNCYANCDGRTSEPRLTIDDFICFIDRFAVQDPYANCTGSPSEPFFSIDDFLCYLNAFAQGCP